jgi:hypothetical protein
MAADISNDTGLQPSFATIVALSGPRELPQGIAPQIADTFWPFSHFK